MKTKIMVKNVVVTVEDDTGSMQVGERDRDRRSMERVSLKEDLYYSKNVIDIMVIHVISEL
jgi:hypothetical protein